MTCWKGWNFDEEMEMCTRVKYDKLKHQMKQREINRNIVLSRCFMIPLLSAAHMDGQRAEAYFYS